MITALAGGIGAAKFLVGLAEVMPPEEMAVIVNTGDDVKLFGLHISPDLDTVTYSLAGEINQDTGWGLSGDAFQCLAMLDRYGCETWFHLGDRDLATHIFRTHLLSQGCTLTQVTDRIRRALGVRARILPMTDAYVPTRVVSEVGDLHLQEYFVRHRSEPRVKALRFQDIHNARPAAGVEAALRDARAIILCPSNPFISIGPILGVPGIRALLAQARAPVIAISPIVAGRALKGPTAKMLLELGHEVSALGVARIYQDCVRFFVLDEQDAGLRPEIEALGMEAILARTVMTTAEGKRALARTVLRRIQP